MILVTPEFELEHSIAGGGSAIKEKGEVELEQAYIGHNWKEYTVNRYEIWCVFNSLWYYK